MDYRVTEFLRKQYEMIEIIKECMDTDDRDVLLKLTKPYKDKIRTALRTYSVEPRKNWHWDDEGYGWYKEVFDAEFCTLEEIEQYAMDSRYFVTSPYDCSGQRFTMSQHIIQCNGLIYFYHFVGHDV